MPDAPVLISDLDGTLIDVRDRFAFAQATTLKNLGYEVSTNHLRDLYRFALDAPQLLKILNISLSSKELTKYYTQIDDEFYSNWRSSFLVPGVIDTLERVQLKVSGMRLITSRGRIDETRKEVQAFNLDRFFERVVTRGDLAKAEGVEKIELFPFIEHRRRLILLALDDLEHDDNISRRVICYCHMKDFR